MRIAVISDVRLPTSEAYPGHGLGKANLAIADGLAERGHEVALFGGKGSAFFGGVTFVGDTEFALARSAAVWGPDVVIDGGHEHWYQRVCPGEPVLNLSHDRERKPGLNAVYPSRAHARWWGDGEGRVIYHGVALTPRPPLPQGEGEEDLQGEGEEEYVVWLGAVDVAHKGAAEAVRVARAAGVPLILAGPGQYGHGGFIGPVSGAAKWALLAGAKALLATGQIESAGLVALEAALVGTPVLCFALGGLPEYVADGLTGYVCADEAAMAAALGRLDALPGPAACRAWVLAERSFDRMIDGWEAAIRAVVERRVAAAGR